VAAVGVSPPLLSVRKFSLTEIDSLLHFFHPSAQYDSLGSKKNKRKRTRHNGSSEPKINLIHWARRQGSFFPCVSTLRHRGEPFIVCFPAVYDSDGKAKHPREPKKNSKVLECLADYLLNLNISVSVLI
jgi:hypothetical protein